MYPELKWVHICMVGLSGIGFIVRGYWMLNNPSLLHRRLVRILPHVVDTVLLISGVWLVLLLGLSPLHQSWLLVKLLLLCVYIFLGMIALRRGRSKTSRIIAGLGAVLVFGVMLVTAITKLPFGLVL